MHGRAAGPRGFTLIEMMVVIAIIVILAAAVIALGTALKANAQLKQTKVTLKALKALYTSYVQEMGGEAPDINTLVKNGLAMPQLKGSLSSLPSNALNYSTSTNSYVVNDGFGFPIVYAPMAPPAASSLGSLQSQNAYPVGAAYKVGPTVYVCTGIHTGSSTWSAVTTVPCFISYGPDNQLGTADDIYDYDP